MRVLLVSSVAAFLAIAGGAYGESLVGGANPSLANTVAGIRTSRSVALLAQERQKMIRLDAAAKTFSVGSSPKLATRPDKNLNAGGPGTSPNPPPVYMPAPDPGTAESIAYKMLPSFGFSPRKQYGCLYNIWMRESGWRYNAENASGAYGIPQALPGSKMASAGPNWETDPTTQIKWGIGYIKSTYGSPCAAWVFWQDNGWY